MANLDIKKGQIGNALESVAPDHVVATADGIFDEGMQMYQSEINQSAGVYDVSASNLVDGEPSTYASLSAVLNADPAVVPENVRKGGMSIKYIQSSDNKYVQFRYMLPYENTTAGNAAFLKVDNWSFCGDDVLVENPEYIRAIIDSEGRLLEATRTDGTKVVNASVEVHGDISTDGVDVKVIENPEFVEVKTDNEGKILFGIQKDGNVLFGAGVPKQIVDYITGKISDLSLDEYEDIVSFLNGLEEGSSTLSELLYGKVDKVEGKSLIDADFASSQDVEENPEYLQVTTDSDSKVIQGIKLDGTSYIGGNLEAEGDVSINGNATIRGNIDLADESIQSVDNPEYLKVTTDAQGKVLDGIKKDGSHYIYNVESESIDALNEEAANKVDKVEGKELSTNDYTNGDKEIVTTYELIDSPEYMSVDTDSESKILGGRRKDGTKFENVAFETLGVTLDGITDKESRTEVTVDSDNKVLSYIDADGVLHEEIGINTKLVKTEIITTSSINTKALTAKAVTFDSETDKNTFAESIGVPKGHDNIKEYNLPKNGTVNILSEVFYLTSNAGYSDLNGVYPIQLYKNNFSNAELKRVCQAYYVKSSLKELGDGTYELWNDGVAGHDIHLNFWPANQIVEDNGYYYVKSLTKVNGNFYYTDTLGKSVDNGVTTYFTWAESVKVDVSLVADDQQTLTNAIEVTQLVSSPNLEAWGVNKKDEHYCLVDVDFGDYLSGQFNIGVKFQGNSTLRRPKRNLRFTFYKNSTFAKKNKIKIGEFVRLSGFNLKAFWGDANYHLTEFLLNRVFEAIWNHRPNADSVYPWSAKDGYYTGATGMIKGFPIQCKINGDFYGFYIFCEKKDEKNYMLDGDDDNSGIFVSSNGGTGWSSYSSYNWADEMGVKNRTLAYPQRVDDSVSTGTAAALDTLFTYIKNENNEFTRSTIPTHLSVLDWIDYIICVQAFLMPDSVINNVILYAGSDKTKFYIFPYDLDNALHFYDANSISKDIFSEFDTRVFDNILNIYKDDVYNRYKELRGSVLNAAYLEKLYDDAFANIPETWLTQDLEKWSDDWGEKRYRNYKDTLSSFNSRLEWLDNNYFTV